MTTNQGLVLFFYTSKMNIDGNFRKANTNNKLTENMDKN